MHRHRHTVHADINPQGYQWHPITSTTVRGENSINTDRSHPCWIPRVILHRIRDNYANVWEYIWRKVWHGQCPGKRRCSSFEGSKVLRGCRSWSRMLRSPPPREHVKGDVPPKKPVKPMYQRTLCTTIWSRSHSHHRGRSRITHPTHLCMD